MKLLISLIGDQTIPNVLCIDHFKPDFLLMVSTDRMGEKVDFILRILKRISKNFNFSEEKGNIWTIKVNPESLADVEEKIEKWFLDYKNNNVGHFDEIVANVTGGTKMMSLGLFNAAKSINIPLLEKKPEIVYIPIGSNKIVDLSEDCGCLKHCEPSSDIDRRLNIIQYFESNGIQLISKDDDMFNNGFNESYEPVKHALKTKDISKFIMQNYESLKNFLASIFHKLKTSDLPFNKKNKPYPIDINCIFNSENHEVSTELIKELFNFSYLNHLTVSHSISENEKLDVNIKGEIAKHEFEFLTGGWLERFCFNELNELKEQGIFNDIAINARVKNNLNGAENEFDVLFTYSNNLYMVECKSLNQEHDSETDILYKISALQADLGRLTTKSFLASTASENIIDKKGNPGEIKETLIKRSKLLNCSIIKPSDLINIKEEIKKVLKIN